MKKIALIFLLGSLLGLLCALESDPSETVGYVRITVNEGYTAFGLPFTFTNDLGDESYAINDVIGDQLTGGNFIFQSDQIIDIFDGASSWYSNPALSWDPNMTLDTEHSFYAKVLSGHGTQDVYLAGRVEPEIIVYSTMMNPGYNPVGIKEAGVVGVEDLDLVESGFTGGNFIFQSDQLIDINTGFVAWYKSSDSTWQSSLTQVEPGAGYFIKVLTGHSAFTWTYDPTDNSRSIINNKEIRVKK